MIIYWLTFGFLLFIVYMFLKNYNEKVQNKTDKEIEERSEKDADEIIGHQTGLLNKYDMLIYIQNSFDEKRNRIKKLKRSKPKWIHQ